MHILVLSMHICIFMLHCLTWLLPFSEIRQCCQWSQFNQRCIQQIKIWGKYCIQDYTASLSHAVCSSSLRHTNSQSLTSTVLVLFQTFLRIKGNREARLGQYVVTDLLTVNASLQSNLIVLYYVYKWTMLCFFPAKLRGRRRRYNEMAQQMLHNSSATSTNSLNLLDSSTEVRQIKIWIYQ